MDIAQLQHDPAAIERALTPQPDHSVIAKVPLKIYFPKRFEEAKLAEIYDKVTSIGLVGVVVGNKYACLGVLANLTFHPGDIAEEMIDGVPFVVLTFEAGETVIENLVVTKNALMVASFCEEFIKYARIPWYIGYEHILQIIDESPSFLGFSPASSPQVLRVIVSLTARDPVDPDVSYRYGKHLNDRSKPPMLIGMNNPGDLLSGTFARFSGGYLNDNIIAGLQEEPEEMQRLEEIFKGIPDE